MSSVLFSCDISRFECAVLLNILSLLSILLKKNILETTQHFLNLKTFDSVR